jgi:CHAT domain-containing protein
VAQFSVGGNNLHNLLIADHIERYGIKQLTIIPHGDLHYLPFHALRGKNSYLSEMALLRILPNMQTISSFH